MRGHQGRFVGEEGLDRGAEVLLDPAGVGVVRLLDEEGRRCRLDEIRITTLGVDVVACVRVLVGAAEQEPIGLGRIERFHRRG